MTWLLANPVPLGPRSACEPHPRHPYSAVPLPSNGNCGVIHLPQRKEKAVCSGSGFPKGS